ncbi:MAG: hypothetical protein ACTSP4_06945 [Candidatus Hodarchaeales archaeon]
MVDKIPEMIKKQIDTLLNTDENQYCGDDDELVLAYPFNKGYERFRMSNKFCPTVLEITLEGIKFIRDNPDKTKSLNIEKEDGTGIISLKIENNVLILDDLINYRNIGRVFLDQPEI